MSATESACYSTPEESGLRVETLSFERIPQHRDSSWTILAIHSRCAGSIRQQSAFITNCNSDAGSASSAYH